MFTAFMWAVATDGRSTMRIDLKGNTTISNPDVFRSENPETLLSLRLENKMLRKTANAIQRSGLGSLQEAYLCIIPPFSCTKRLPIEAVVDFVRLRMRDYEVLGQWEKVVPVYVKLFRICRTFEATPLEGLHKATAILIHVFLSVCESLRVREEQQRRGNVEVLQRLKDEILQELNSQLKLNSLRDLIYNFAKLYKMQNRLDSDVWNDLAPDAASEDDGSGNVHAVFQHPTVFSTITSIHPWNGEDLDSENSNARDVLDWTPLHYAAAREGGNNIVIRKLLNVGADPKATDLAEWTPLHYVIDTATTEKRLRAVIWTLLEGGADIDMRGRDGMAPLHCAAKKGYAKVTSMLLQAGAAIEIQDNSRKTPLHWAAHNGCSEVIKTLLENGAYLEARDDYGRTVLHLAATTGATDTVRLFTQNKVETNAKARDGRTALHLAAKGGHEPVARLLVEHMANKDARNNIGRTALHVASRFGHEAVVRLLLEHEANKDALDNSGRTALRVAARFGHGAIVRLLLEHGADKEARATDGRTALNIATEIGHDAVVKLLS
jgi:ankyrin repeat protein